MKYHLQLISAYTFLVAWLSFNVPLAYGQITFIDDFTIVGDTYRTEDECFRLTEEEYYASGAIWYKKPISLASSFSVDLNLMLGCKDASGADGMVFVMTAEANQVGFRGEGIGFAGLVPSIGIEVDTWLNEHLLDPVEDHLAIMANGRIGHYNNLAGPNTIPNIEDCNRHLFSVIWDPGPQKLSVEIDGKEVIAVKYDLINQVFGGNNVVYWGVTAATGRYSNIHEVCFDRLSFYEPSPLQSLEQKPKGYWGE